MAAISLLALCLFLVSGHASWVIKIVVVLNSGTRIESTFRIPIRVSRRLHLDDETTAELSDELDLAVGQRDWKFKLKSIEAFNKHNRRLKVSSTVNGIEYDLRGGLVAVGFPPDLHQPLHPIVYVRTKRGSHSTFSIDSRDWRRYVKARDVDAASTVSPSSHDVHIPRVELDVITELTKEHGKIVKIKAGGPAQLKEHNLYSVTSCNQRDELVVLSRDKRLSGICDADAALAEEFLESGLTDKETLEAVDVYNGLQSRHVSQGCAVM